jgi:hypothetical protein
MITASRPTRRLCIVLLGAGTTSLVFERGRSFAQAVRGTVDDAIKEFSESPELSFENYSFREYAENFPAVSLERAPSHLKPSKLSISDAAKKLILAFEVSNEKTYAERYQHPIWPGGRSGVTIGIGYDLGYASKDDVQTDWGLIINDPTASQR